MNYRSTQDKIHNFLSDLQDELGPSLLDTGGESGGLLSEWVLVMNWVDPNDGKSYMTRVTSHHLLDHHRDGLIFNALYKFP